MSLLFLSDALANTSATPDGSPSPYSILIMLIIFGIIFYWMILRPQQKRIKGHKELINSISKGDEVLTTGGLIGRVVKIMENNYIFIAINETNEVLIKRDFVAAVLPKGTIKALLRIQ